VCGCDAVCYYKSVHRRRLLSRRRRRRRGRGRCGLRGRCVVRGIERCVELVLAGFREKKQAYLAIILPGNATLTVHSLPFVGWKTAVGLEVSTAAGAFEVVPLGIVFASDRRFRFYIEYP
jgi:hypothetical protein